MDSIMQNVGKRIRAYRQKNGLTQEELAEIAEVHPTYIGQVERGEKNLTIGTLEKILHAFRISPAEFFECFKNDYSHEDLALKCYNIISGEPPEKQKKYYDILCSIKQISSSK